MKKKIDELEKLVTSILTEAPSPAQREDTLKRFTRFAGNDTRLLKRLPLVKRKSIMEQNLIRALKDVEGSLKLLRLAEEDLK